MKSNCREARLTLVHSAPEPLRGFRVSDTEWLAAFYPWLAEHDDWSIELRTVADGSQTPVAVQVLRKADEIATRVRHHREQAARADADGPRPLHLLWRLQPQGSRPGGDAKAFVALGCRTDCGDWTAWPVGERPRAIWEALHGCPAAPSVVNWTGDGFEAWWLLREPLLDTHRGEEAQRAIVRCLPQRGSSGFFRWPHTASGGRDLRPVQVVWWQPGQRFSLEALLERFGTAHGEYEAQWGRFLRLLPAPARMMWGSFAMASVKEPDVLNLGLASTLLLHGSERSDYEAVAAMAPWNAGRVPSATELDLLWRKAQGTDATAVAPDPRRPLQSSPAEDGLRAPHPTGASPHQVEQKLPGLLLDSLPETAWTDWARLYRSAVGACTEAADELHYLALMTVLGAAFARSVVVHCGRPVYLNMYTVLVGPTGDRKSTAAQLALDLLPQIKPGVLQLNGVGSQEGLMERMASQDEAAPTLWFVDELASLLKKARRESSGGLLELMTELFHCPDFKTHATRARAIHLSAPTLSILGGSTPTWLETAMQQDDILGGFANRFVYVTGQPKPDNPLPSRPDARAVQELTTWVRQAVQVPRRELTLAAGARDKWRDFYVEWRCTTNACNDQVAALLRRIDHYILKFAALAAAMEHASEITSSHLESGIDLGRFLAGCAYRILGDLGASSDARLETLVERKLQEAQGQMRRKQLRQALGGRISGEKLDRVLAAMERNGLLLQTDDKAERGVSRLVQLT